MYTVQQVAERLNTSLSLIYALCAQGRLDHLRIGLGRGTIRISDDALQEFLSMQSRSPTRPKHSHLKHLKPSSRN